MGKVRIKTLGSEEFEKEEREKRKAEREAKKAAEAAKAPVEQDKEQEASADSTQETNGEKTRPSRAHHTSKRYKESAQMVDDKATYPLEKAIGTLKSFKKSKFNETVELHINTTEKGVSGQIALPHGTGKKLRIKVADDALIEAVEKGKIDFDILIAEPEMMPKLAKVARILGPRGLMPNPKAGTITSNPKETIEKLSAGQVNYKTESQHPVIHLAIGKLSFEDKQIQENVKTVLSSIGLNKIKSATLTSTMSPGVKLEVK